MRTRKFQFPTQNGLYCSRISMWHDSFDSSRKIVTRVVINIIESACMLILKCAYKSASGSLKWTNRKEWQMFSKLMLNRPIGASTLITATVHRSMASVSHPGTTFFGIQNVCQCLNGGRFSLSLGKCLTAANQLTTTTCQPIETRQAKC